MLQSFLDNDEAPEYLIQASVAETALVTWTRAIYGKNQLYEKLVEFWHDHFNISVEVDEVIGLLLPIYDREVIRKHTLGNFRTFLEAVAKSPCMLYYLDNANSKASPANENYARELLELHTLGAMHYYNHLYDDWKQVPRGEDGIAKGYIDEDVYEAARAFTEWTVGDGHEDEEEIRFPSTGAFYYHDRWHDHYQKKILGQEFKSHQDAMADGLQVLDLLAFHEGTAKHLCTKLCQWLLGENPPENVVNKAISTWMKAAKAEDQIAQTVRTILLAPEFEASLGNKLKRPNHLLISLLRQMELDIPPSVTWSWMLREMGYKQFSWPTPIGHPDKSSYWLNTDMLLKRWNAIPMLFYIHQEEQDEYLLSEATLALNDTTLPAVFNHWAEKLLGDAIPENTMNQILTVLAKDMEYFPKKDLKRLLEENPEWLEYKLIQLIGYLALTPLFQKH